MGVFFARCIFFKKKRVCVFFAKRVWFIPKQVQFVTKVGVYLKNFHAFCTHSILKTPFSNAGYAPAVITIAFCKLSGLVQMVWLSSLSGNGLQGLSYKSVISSLLEFQTSPCA